MKNNLIKLLAFCFIVFLLPLSTIFQSCNKKECGYDNQNPPVNVGCIMSDSLNLSTGIDANGSVIAAAKGAVDPFWRVINRPPLQTQTSPLIPSINGSAYVMSWGAPGWAAQLGTGIIAPADLGINGTFGDNNAKNTNGIAVPYVFERPFCVLKDTKVNFTFTSKADDSAHFELVNNITNTVVSAGSGATLSNTMIWSAANLALSAGSYSIRGYLINTGAVILGFSFKGSITSVNSSGTKDAAISNNNNGCCENNTISIVNIYDENCNKKFDAADAVAAGWVFTIKQGTTVIRTGTTDINGNIFFSGLPNGTYTVEKTPKSGFTSYNPSTASVTLNNNQVKILEFFHCK